VWWWWQVCVLAGAGLRPAQPDRRGFAPPNPTSFYDERFTTNVLRRTFFEKVSELVSWARQNKPFLLGQFVFPPRSERYEIVAN